jgi:hypothetical protein
MFLGILDYQIQFYFSAILAGLPSNIRLALKYLIATNTLAYFQELESIKLKKLMTIFFTLLMACDNFVTLLMACDNFCHTVDGL